MGIALFAVTMVSVLAAINFTNAYVTWLFASALIIYLVIFSFNIKKCCTSLAKGGRYFVFSIYYKKWGWIEVIPLSKKIGGI